MFLIARGGGVGACLLCFITPWNKQRETNAPLQQDDGALGLSCVDGSTESEVGIRSVCEVTGHVSRVRDSAQNVLVGTKRFWK